MLWDHQVGHAHYEASLVADAAVREIGPRTAARATLRRMAHEAADDGLNRFARMEILDAMDPEREGLGLPMVLLDPPETSSGVPYLRALWVVQLLDGVPTIWVFDVPEHDFRSLSRWDPPQPDGGHF